MYRGWSLGRYSVQVACEYLTDPGLFVRDGIGPVKFDLRVIVMLSSILKIRYSGLFKTMFVFAAV